MSLQIQQSISLANDFTSLGPNTKYAYYIDYINKASPALIFATLNDGKIILSSENDSKLVEREYGSSQTKVLEIHHFEDNRFFVLMEKNEKQIIGVVQFSNEMEIIDKESLVNEIFDPVGNFQASTFSKLSNSITLTNRSQQFTRP